MDMLSILIAVAQAAAVLALIALVWLIATWYAADDQPAFGPFKSGRITFKTVLQTALRDTREVFKPALDQVRVFWLWCGQTIGIAVISLDVYVAQTPELKAAILAAPLGLPALLALNLATAFARVAQAKPAQ